MKFRAKIDTPWCKRGEIFKLDNYPEQEKSICYEYKSRAILFDLNGIDATQAYEKIVEGK